MVMNSRPTTSALAALLIPGLTSVVLAGTAAPAHADAPRCGGLRATIVGTAGVDAINGTAARDVIVARGGDDRIRGLEGNDVVCGGRGGDLIEVAGAHARVFGGPGNDAIVARGRLRIHGGPGADKILLTGPRPVRVYGDGGADEISLDRPVTSPKHIYDGGPGRDGLSLVLGDYGHAPVHLRTYLGTGRGVFNGVEFSMVSFRKVVLHQTAPGDTWFARGSAADERFESGYGVTTTIEARGGDDYLRSDNGDDWLDGGIGYDTAYAGHGQDTCVAAERTRACENVVPG